jgi:hypothetical protein
LCSHDAANAAQASDAGALQATVAAMRAHAADAGVQSACCIALDCMLNALPRLREAAGAAGALEAVRAALQLPGDARSAALLQRQSCSALVSLVEGHNGNASRACAAGIIEALPAIMTLSYAHVDYVIEYSLYDSAVRILDALLQGSDAAAADRAIHAGVLDIIMREGTERSDPSMLLEHARLLLALQAAAQRHDAAVCTHNGCKRCAAARDTGYMCALAGCGARKRADDSGKRLLRCGACRTAAYCGPAHQREHWERHKTECAALGAAARQQAGEPQ